MTLKAQLLTPITLAPVTVTVLGGEFPARRLSAAVLSNYDKEVRRLQELQDSEKLNKASAQLILESLLDEDNQPMINSVNADQLMEVHTPTAINAAVFALININYLGDSAGEDAKKD